MPPPHLLTRCPKGHGAACVLRGVDTLLHRVLPRVSRAASACVLGATFGAFPTVAALPLASDLAKRTGSWARGKFLLRGVLGLSVAFP